LANYLVWPKLFMMHKTKGVQLTKIHINEHMHMIWFDRSTYVFRVIVVTLLVLIH